MIFPPSDCTSPSAVEFITAEAHAPMIVALAFAEVSLSVGMSAIPAKGKDASTKIPSSDLAVCVVDSSSSWSSVSSALESFSRSMTGTEGNAHVAAGRGSFESQTS